MKISIRNFVLASMSVCALLLTGCSGGSSDKGTASSSSIKLGESSDYEYGVTFAAPEGWTAAGRQGKIIVKFDNPKMDGQSVFVRNPEAAEIKTLASEDDAKTAGLDGSFTQLGSYGWVVKAQRSKDPKTEDVFDNLNCSTVQFGKKFTVTIRGYKGQNENAEGVMNAVLGAIKFAETTAESAETKIDENTEFNLDF